MTALFDLITALGALSGDLAWIISPPASRGRGSAAASRTEPETGALARAPGTPQGSGVSKEGEEESLPVVLDLRLELRANARLRCGYCHDELEASAEAWRCARCETPQHSSCQAELGRCQVIGCDSSPRQAPRARGDSWLKRGFRGALCALSGALALMAFAAAAYVGVMSLVLATHLVTQRPLDLSAWLFAGAFSLPALAFAALVTWLGLALWEAAREAWTSSQSAGSAHA